MQHITTMHTKSHRTNVKEKKNGCPLVIVLRLGLQAYTSELPVAFEEKRLTYIRAS